MTEVVSGSNLCQAFHHRFVLRDISFSVQSGEILAVTGENGSGKTTLLRILATLLTPTSGSFSLFGQKHPQCTSSRPRLGASFVQSFLHEDLSIHENLTFYSRLYGLSKERHPLDPWLERFNLSGLTREPVRTLSRGERQKVSLLRSLLHKPELLLWDEPTTGLDDKSRTLLNEIVAEHDNRTTLIFSTHEPMLVKQWSTQSLHLDRGRIL